MDRTEIIAARANEVEKRALAEVAERESRTASEMLRELVRKAAFDHGVWPRPERHVKLTND